MGSMPVGEHHNMKPATLLPVGSIEQHGFLPLETDTLIARAFCELSADRFDVIVEEAVEEGFCPTTCALAGTEVLRFEEILNRVSGRVMRMIDEGRHYVILINVHGGNDSILTAVVQDTYIDRGFPLLYFNPYTAFANELNSVCFGGGDNSYKECSLLLAAMDILGKEPISGPPTDEVVQRDTLVENLKKAGMLGFSYEEPSQHVAWRSGATARAGREFLEATVTRFQAVVEDFQQYVENELAKAK